MAFRRKLLVLDKAHELLLDIIAPFRAFVRLTISR